MKELKEKVTSSAIMIEEKDHLLDALINKEVIISYGECDHTAKILDYSNKFLFVEWEGKLELLPITDIKAIKDL